MSDISIGKIGTDVPSTTPSQGSKYQELKREYQKFLKQAEKSDLQNSLTFKQKQLEMLAELKKAASEEGNYSDYDMIVEEMWCLASEISEEEEKASSQVTGGYVPPVQISKPQKDLVSLFNACKNSNGELDEEARRIVLAFKDSGVDARGLSRFVDKCRGLEEIIPLETVEALEKLCAAKVSPSVIFDAVDASPVLQKNEVGSIDFSWVDDLIAYKSVGIDETVAFRFARKLNSDYENKKDVYSSVEKIMNAGFDEKRTVDIISSFSVSNPKTEKTRLNVKSINSVLGMKKMLSSSHSVERNERKNPINKLGQLVLSFDDNVFVLKNDRVIEIIDLKEKSQQKVSRKYEDVASVIENNIITDFIKKYKTEDGNLDQNALRVFSSLRSAGISYDYLLPLVEASLDVIAEEKEIGAEKHYDIDIEKVNAIITLKKSGALSEDVSKILDALGKDKDGKYSANDIENACYLTGLIIAGDEVAELLPEVSKDYQVKEFVTNFSPIMETKHLLLPLVNLTKNTNGTFDDDAAEVLYNLSERFLLNEEDEMTDTKFYDYAKKVIELSKSPASGNVDENSLNVCIAMCRNGETSDNILNALELCKDEYGYPNEALADIIWDMSKQQSKFEDIVSLINICKPVSGILDIERASAISELLDNNCSIEEVMAFAQGLGNN